MSLILNFFEANNVVGWNSGRAVDTIRNMQQICSEHIAEVPGIYLAFLLHMQRALDMLYQTRIAFSLFYHHLDRLD